jgi:predicted transcriptional regulator
MTERRTRGALESAVLRILWDAGSPLSARDIQSRFDQSASIPALTTLLTVLDRLRAKQHVEKLPVAGGGFVFSAAQSESRYAADAMLSALVGSSDRSAALLRFAGDLSERDIQLLRTAIDASDATREG